MSDALLGAPAMLRVQVQIATDDFLRNVNHDPGLYQSRVRILLRGEEST